MYEKRVKMEKSKKAVSPVITTVLLILIVLVLALLIFLWARGFIKEQLSKFDEPVERACKRIKIDASYSSTTKEVSVVNLGDIPIYQIGLNIEGGAEDQINYLESTSGDALRGGGTGIYPLAGGAQTGDTIEIIPVILGENEDGQAEPFACLDYKKKL